ALIRVARSLCPNVRSSVIQRPLSTMVARRGIYPHAELSRNAEPRNLAMGKPCESGDDPFLGGSAYLISTAAPAPSSCSLALSAASLFTFSRTGFGGGPP